MRDRELHAHIKRRIQRELRGRSWSWLADASGIPQSTLAGQSARPKFSLDVLVRIAATLGRSPSYFLPPQTDAGGRSDPTQAEAALKRIQSVLEDFQDGA